MKQRFLTKLVLLSIAVLVCMQCNAFATISNKSNGAVQVKIKKTSGFSEKHTLFPGQSISMPERAKSVEVISISGSSRADEKLEITVLEQNGKEALIDKYNEVYTLGKNEDDVVDTPTVMQNGKATNQGNIPVDLLLKNQYNFIQKRPLSLGQSVIIPKDIVEVEVTSNVLVRGDQKLQISITLPDGVTHIVNRAGGIVKVVSDGF